VCVSCVCISVRVHTCMCVCVRVRECVPECMCVYACKSVVCMFAGMHEDVNVHAVGCLFL